MAIVGRAEVEVVTNARQAAAEIEQLGTAGSRVGGAFRGLIGATKDLDASLKNIGLSSQDLAIILGAGLAGGAAFALREIGRFVVESVQAAARLEDARNLTVRVFEDQSEAVLEFAESARTSFGLSERAALAAAAQFGLFAKNVGLPVEAAEKLSTSLTRLAADIASAQPDFVDIEEVLIALRAALRGERDPLERFGVTLTDAGVKAQAVKLDIAEFGDELTSSEKVVASYAAILEQTNDIQGDFADTADSLPNTMNSFNAAVEDFQASLGSTLVPAVTEAIKSLNDLLELNTDIIEGLRELRAASKEASTGQEELAKRLTDPVGNSIAKFVAGPFGQLLRSYREAKGFAEELAGSQEDLASAEDIAADAAVELAKANEDASRETEKLADATERFNRALEDSELRINKAEIALDRAFQDFEIRTDKAERSLREAIEDRSDAIASAEERLSEVRAESAERVRDARERVSDFVLDATRREREAEQRLADLRLQHSFALVRGKRAVEAAVAAGNAQAENDARLALAEEQRSRDVANTEQAIRDDTAEQERELDRLRDELKDAQEQRIEDIKEAEQDLARVVEETAERVEEAERGVTEAYRQSQRAIDDALRSLEDAHRDSKRAIDDAAEALDRLEQEAREARQEVKKLNDELAKLNDPFQIPTIPGGPITQFQHGGDFSAGQSFLVGEAGPELLRFSRGGHIDSNADLNTLIVLLRKFLAQQPASTGGVGPIHITSTDPRAVVNELMFTLAQGVRP